MLYYITLLLVIVVVSVIAIWAYRAIVGMARTAHTAMLPTRRKISAKTKARLKSRQKMRSKAKVSAKRASGSEIPTPWGWRDEAHTVHSPRPQQSTNKPGSDRKLWSGSSRKSAINERNAGYSVSSNHEPGYSKPEQKAARQRVGWPYREDKMAFAGKAYKVSRKATEGSDVATEGKPWVW